MPLLLVGLNHQTAPVAIRERVAFTPQQIESALPGFCQAMGASEALIISTCNRTEIYSVGVASEMVQAWWGRERQLELDSLTPHLYFHHDLAVVKHLAQVASGLNSMVLGEPQVFGQVKAAYQLAQNAGTLGSRLQRLCQHSFHVAKKIRTQTDIGQKPVSLAFTAVSLVRRIFVKPVDCNVVLLGAGETIALVAQHLAEMGVQRFSFVNRSLSRACELAQRWQGEAFELSELESVLANADIIVAATDSPEVLLHEAQLRRAHRHHRRKATLLIDLSVPRNIDPAIGALSDCYLYGLDDLQQLIQETLASRQEAARQAEAIIEVEMLRYHKKSQHIAKAAHIQSWYQQAHTCRDQQVAAALHRLEHGGDAKEVIHQLAHRLTQQLLHMPLQILKEEDQ